MIRLILLTLCAAMAGANAVTLVSYNSQTFAGPGTTGAYNFTVSGASNRLLIVGYQHERSATPTSEINTLTYGGVSMNLAVRQVNSSTQEIAEIWYLVAPATGTGSLSATLNQATESGRGFRLTAIELSEAAQTAPEAAMGSDAGTGTTAISTSITTLTDDALLLGFTHNQASHTYLPGTGVTEIFDLNAASINAAFGTKSVASAGATSFDWTQSNTGLNVQAVISVANIPEPSSAMLLILGVVTLGMRRRR